MRAFLYSIVFISIFLYVCCYTQGWADEQRNIYIAGIPPIAGILDHLVLPHEQVQVLTSSNVNPHTFDVSPSQLQKLTQASIFFHTIFPFELKVVNTLKNTESKVLCVDVTPHIIWRRGQVHHDHGHDDHGHHHEEENKDLHCWLNPANLEILSTHIYNALIKNNPTEKEAYQSRFEKWQNDLKEMDKKIKQILLPHKGKNFFVFHPAFGYFADYYGLKEVCIEMEGKSPSPKQIQTLMEQMQREKTKVIFIQPQFDPKPAELIAKSIGSKVEVINDFERDILNHLLYIAERISSSYK